MSKPVVLAQINSQHELEASATRSPEDLAPREGEEEEDNVKLGTSRREKIKKFKVTIEMPCKYKVRVL